MKNFKEFKKEYKDVLGLTEEIDYWNAYECYALGFIDGKEEAFKVILSAPITMPQMPNPIMPPYTVTCDTQTQLMHEEAEKMKVYPEQLKKEYSPEELEEIKKAMVRMRNLSEEERKAEFATQVEELKQK